MEWILLILINAFCTSAVVLMQKVLFRKDNKNAVLCMVLIQFLTGAFLAVLAVIHAQGSEMKLQIDLPFLAMCILYSIALVFRFRSLQEVDSSSLLLSCHLDLL